MSPLVVFVLLVSVKNLTKRISEILAYYSFEVYILCMHALFCEVFVCAWLKFSSSAHLWLIICIDICSPTSEVYILCMYALVCFSVYMCVWLTYSSCAHLRLICIDISVPTSLIACTECTAED